MKDLFETPELIPENIMRIILSFDENKDPYKELDRVKSECENNGYTFDYYLDCEPYNLRNHEHTKH